MLSLSASGLSEAWNYNGSREEAYAVEAGLTYGVRDRVAVGITTVTVYVSQRRTDAFAIGCLGGVKWAVYQGGGRTVSLDVEVGAARAEIPVPPRGTRFNYLWRVGASATTAVWRDVHAVAAFGWLHVSNNSLRGPDRNPDIQALGFKAGVLIPF
ncbi:MAG TPA: hypothetical protein VK886_08095 [Vicinamibacterales bacterium]|nr:hypothetical protein [Vicinamibacterales bacterium]